MGWGHITILYKAPEDYTKPKKTIQSPKRLYKAPTDYTKHLKNRQRPTHVKQRHKILNKTNK